MSTAIDYRLPFKQIQKENTEKERQRMLADGMEELTEQDFLNKLSELNYKVSNSMTFNYYNTGNAISYLAKSMSYTDIKTKQSYAHYEQAYCNADNLSKLQKIRSHYFVFTNGRIWEL